ncbi:hypothetical protein [Pseudovibrio sp. Alg231-02]|uniref:hypothetical protein n=1 Tax=Pseudovibrio sp. Alg231-02 TaxID=1922223 RepID=UPI000D54CB85|nr:hypothetical protein [Pseudovibrio sp. Alg231-02]
MPPANLLVDSVISISAFFGAFVVIIVLKPRGAQDYLVSRFLFVLYLVAGLMLVRTIDWYTGSAFFKVATLILASLIPLSILLLTEALLRRHAPLWSKWVTASGTALLLILSVFSQTFVGPVSTIALFTFQAYAFGLAAYLIVTRDKASLTAEENKTISRFALALVLILPLLITDFPQLSSLFPARLAGIAVLFSCWLVMNLRRSQFIRCDAVITFGVTLAITFGVTWCLGQVLPLDARTQMQVASMLLAFLMLFTLLLEAYWSWTNKRNHGLLHHVVGGSIASLDSFLRFKQDNSLLGNALVLQPSDLGDFDLDFLRELFSNSPVLRRPDNTTDAELSERAKEQMDWLFKKYDATHILLVGENPLRLLALSLPQITNSSGGELEFEVFQRTAYLISQSENVK